MWTYGRTDVRTDGRTHLSSNLLGHRRGDDLKIGELRSTNSGVYGDGLSTIYVPSAGNRRKAFDHWDSHSTMDGRNR